MYHYSFCFLSMYLYIICIINGTLCTSISFDFFSLCIYILFASLMAHYVPLFLLIFFPCVYILFASFCMAHYAFEVVRDNATQTCPLLWWLLLLHCCNIQGLCVELLGEEEFHCQSDCMASWWGTSPAPWMT